MWGDWIEWSSKMRKTKNSRRGSWQYTRFVWAFIWEGFQDCDYRTTLLRNEKLAFWEDYRNRISKWTSLILLEKIILGNAVFNAFRYGAASIVILLCKALWRLLNFVLSMRKKIELVARLFPESWRSYKYLLTLIGMELSKSLNVIAGCVSFCDGNCWEPSVWVQGI